MSLRKIKNILKRQIFRKLLEVGKVISENIASQSRKKRLSNRADSWGANQISSIARLQQSVFKNC